MTFNSVQAQDRAFFEKLLTPTRALSGQAIRDDYAHDEMTEYGSAMPEMVLQPLTTQEVSAILAHCHGRNLAVTPRGAGTGLCGGAVCIHGGVLLSLERMTQVLEIDKVNMTATAQAGVLLMHFAKLVEAQGLFYPPDPGEKSATLGGNVATNAGGMRAVRYGVTRDYVLGMTVVLADGGIEQLGGKVVKNASGYSLLNLMVGSEGTLGVITEIIVKLLPLPGENLSVLAPFQDLSACVAAVPGVLGLGVAPTAVEFMEREVILCAQGYLGKAFPHHTAPAYLLLRLDAQSEAAMEDSLKKLTQTLLELGAQDVLLADTDERKMSIWDARGAFLEAIKNATPALDECDVVVPREQIADYVRFAVEAGQQAQVRMLSFGHAGDGNLHIYALRDDLDAQTWQSRCDHVMGLLYDRAQAVGGQVSGEHGIGHAKKDFLLASVGEGQLALMRGIKKVFDPKGILNPGKVV